MLFRKIHAINNYERELSRKKKKTASMTFLLTAHFLFVKSGEKHATKTTLTNKANSNNSCLLIM